MKSVAEMSTPALQAELAALRASPPFVPYETVEDIISGAKDPDTALALYEEVTGNVLQDWVSPPEVLTAKWPELAKAKPDPTTIQSLILSKKKFPTEAAAKKWVTDNGFKAGAADETENTWRFRQFNPDQCKAGSFRTIRLTDGVQAVICKKKEAEASVSLEPTRQPVGEQPPEEVAEEQAEMIIYQELSFFLGHLGDLVTGAEGIVKDLIADESETPAETPEEEGAEEEIEWARLTVLSAVYHQMHGVVRGLDDLTDALLCEEESEDGNGGGDGDWGGPMEEALRKRIAVALRGFNPAAMPIPGSFEAISRTLREKADTYLRSQPGVKIAADDFVYMAGTFADHALPVVGNMGRPYSEDVVYQASWEQTDGGPTWTGVPLEVDLTIEVHILPALKSIRELMGVAQRVGAVLNKKNLARVKTIKQAAEEILAEAEPKPNDEPDEEPEDKPEEEAILEVEPAAVPEHSAPSASEPVEVELELEAPAAVPVVPELITPAPPSPAGQEGQIIELDAEQLKASVAAGIKEALADLTGDVRSAKGKRRK